MLWLLRACAELVQARERLVWGWIVLQQVHRGRAVAEHRQAGVLVSVTCYRLRQPVQKIVGTKVVLT